MKKILIIVLIALMTVVAFAEKKTIHINNKPGKMILEKDYIYMSEYVYIEKEGDYAITTEEATLTKKGEDFERFIANGITHSVFNSGEATSMVLDFNLKNSTGVMRENVIAVFRDKKDNKPIHIENAEELEFDLDNEIYTGFASENGENPLLKILYKGDMEIVARYFEYDSSASRIFLRGDVFVDDKKNERKIEADELTYNTEDDTFEAINAVMEIVVEEEE